MPSSQNANPRSSEENSCGVRIRTWCVFWGIMGLDVWKKKLESEMNYSWSQLLQFDYVPSLGHCCQEVTREPSLLKCLRYIFTGFLLHAPFWQQIITKTPLLPSSQLSATYWQNLEESQLENKNRSVRRVQSLYHKADMRRIDLDWKTIT